MGIRLALEARGAEIAQSFSRSNSMLFFTLLLEAMLLVRILKCCNLLVVRLLGIQHRGNVRVGACVASKNHERP